MKKLLVVLVALAIVAFGAMAFAADVTVGGSIDIRSRAFTNLDLDKTTSAGSDRYTQERVRLNVDGKVGDAKARITFENDYQTWGTEVGVTNLGTGGAGAVESKQVAGTGTTAFGIREAWLDTPLFGPVGLKAGHQFLQLGNGWFLRNMKYGDDAWLAYMGLDKVTIAFADAKVAERANDDDSDFYAGLAVMKLGDMGTAGVDISHVVIRKKHDIIINTVLGPMAANSGDNTLDNVGLNANLGLGPVKLAAELDVQMGKNTDGTDPVTGFTVDSKYKGNQLVLQGTVPMDKVSINFTAARGTGDKFNSTFGTPGYGNPTKADVQTLVPFLDVDPHYTVIYEYLIGQSLGGANASPNAVGAHSGFANTFALSAGADANLGSVSVGGNVWFLKATEKISQDTATLSTVGLPVLSPSDALGLEIDARINWKLNDAVSWNWNLAYFKPGDAYKQTKEVLDPLTGAPTGIFVAKSPDASTVIQGVLTMKF